MMLRYVDRDGDVAEGRDAADVVNHLRLQSRVGRGQTVPAFMRGFAERAAMMSGAKIRTTSEQKFIDDLVTAGYLTPQ